jgi:hypothetical protein
MAARVYAVTNLLTLALMMYAFPHWFASYLIWTNQAETARNILAHESVFHYFMTFELVYGIGSLAMLTALYVVLRPVSRGLALFAALGNLIWAFMWLLWIAQQLFGLRIMHAAGALQKMDPQQLQALAGLQLSSGWDLYYIGLAFLGVSSALFCYLFLRSRYIPRVLSGLGVVASLFEGVCGGVYLLYPGFGNVVSVNYYEMPSMFFGLGLCAWILIKGLKLPETSSIAASAN